MPDIIYDRIPEGINPRKPIPLSVKLKAVLLQFGLDPSDVQYDHRPPLWDRKWNATQGDTEPPANDPACIRVMTTKNHDIVTNGRGGERRISSAGSDTHARAQRARLEGAQAEFRANLLRKDLGEAKPERRLTRRGHRPFPKGRKFGPSKPLGGKGRP